MDDLLTAIVVAGGKAKPAFVAATGVTNRALVELAPGKTMLEFVVDALRGASSVGRIIIVGDVPQPPAPDGSGVDKVAVVLAPGDSLIRNTLIGCEAAQVRAEQPVLLVSSDIPFITSTEVDSFTRSALESHGDFCYPIIPMADYNRCFPQMKRTTMKVREGEFTGGNVMMMRAWALTEGFDAINTAYTLRKSVFKLASMLGRAVGWGVLARIILAQCGMPGLLRILVLEKAVGKVLGARVVAKAIVTHDAAIGTDVDKMEDVQIAREMLAARLSPVSAAGAQAEH